MKKIVFVSLLSLFYNFNTNLNAQVYYKIPTDTNHYWRQFSICLPNPNTVNRLDYQIKYFKDTVIQAKTYSVYETFGRQWGFEYCRSFIKRGFIRQDTSAKKVFILDSAYVERPLYDFSKNLNDTLLSYNNVLHSTITLTVTSVATATLSDGTYRKVLWVSGGNCFVEGVGSVFGGLYGHNQASFSNGLTEQLICFGTITPFFRLLEGITQFQYVCSFVPATVGVDDLQQIKSYNITIFPNPNNGIFEIEFISRSNNNLSYKLSNFMGQEILYDSIKAISGSNHFKIDISEVPIGIYILNIFDNNQAVHKQKIIKQ